MDYSLLVMASTGMMKMATGDGFPSPAGYWNISRLVFHRYRVLRRGSGESRIISDGFYIYRIFGRRFHAKMGHEEGTRHQGASGPSGAPWWVVPTSWLFSGGSSLQYCLFGPEKITKKFRVISRTFIFCTKTTPR